MADKATSDQIDALFDSGEDVLPFADEATFERPRLVQRRVSVDMTVPMITRLDGYAEQYGVTRQSLIKVWIAERLNKEDDRQSRPIAAEERQRPSVS